MDNFSKLHPPNAVHIKVNVIVKNIKPNTIKPPSQPIFISKTPPPQTKVHLKPQVQRSRSYHVNEKSDSYACLDNLKSPPTQKVSLTEKEDAYKIIAAKKLFVDPLMTSYDVLYNLIIHAFQLEQSEFKMSYLSRGELNKATTADEYISLFNDWDLDAAFLNSSQPYLSLNVELLTDNNNINNSPNKSTPPTNTQNQQTQESSPSRFYTKNPTLNPASNVNNEDDWQVINTNEIAPKKLNTKNNTQHSQSSINLMNLDASGQSVIALWSTKATEKVTSVFQKQFNTILNSISRSGSFSSMTAPAASHSSSFSSKDYLILKKLTKKTPLGDVEFRNFLDSDGRIVQMQELRQRIFDGGCEHQKRKELWPIILGVFPPGCPQMTFKQRGDFLRLKSAEYVHLKNSLWLNTVVLNQDRGGGSVSSLTSSTTSSSSSCDQVSELASRIHKDVWRTDRNHKFYSGDTNKNSESLFNILMTYSLANNHQCNSRSQFNYAQGMSDLLSPLLYVMKDEALAYICFCSLIKRCDINFSVLCDNISVKIDLLACLLKRNDPEFWQYLVKVGADKLLFVYRWLLIECKREFSFEDSLNALEVMWSTISPKNGLLESQSQSQMRTQSLVTHHTTSFIDTDIGSNNSSMTNNNNKPSISANGRSLSNASSISMKILRAIDPTYNHSVVNGKERERSNTLKRRKSSNASDRISGNNDYLTSTNEDDGFSEMLEDSSSMSNKSHHCHHRHHHHHHHHKKVHNSSNKSSETASVTSSENNNNNNNNKIETEEIEAQDKHSKLQDVSKTSKSNRPATSIPQRLRYYSLNNNSIYNKTTDDETTDDDDDDEQNDQQNDDPITSQKSSYNDDAKPSSYTEPRKHFFLQLCSQQLKEKKRLIKLRIKNKKYFNYLKKYKSNLKRFNSIKSSNLKAAIDDRRHAQQQQPPPSLRRSLSLPDNCSSIQYTRDNLVLRRQLSLLNLDLNCLAMQSEDCKSNEIESRTKSGFSYIKKLSNIPKENGTSKVNRQDSIPTSLSNIVQEDLPKITTKTVQNPTQTQTQRLSSLLKFKIFSKSLDSHTSLASFKQTASSSQDNDNDSVFTSSLKNDTISIPDIVINSPETPPPPPPPLPVTNDQESKKKTSTSSCSTPYFKSQQITVDPTVTHKRVSLPTPISIDEQKKLHHHHDISRISYDEEEQEEEFSRDSPLSRAELEEEEEDEQLCYSLSQLDNPFLLFMCLAIFIEKREHILKNELDANDIACYFDKMTRKHDVKSVLTRARHLYTKLYLSKANLYNYIHHAMEI
jgi:hypothetical protein